MSRPDRVAAGLPGGGRFSRKGRTASTVSLPAAVGPEPAREDAAVAAAAEPYLARALAGIGHSVVAVRPHRFGGRWAVSVESMNGAEATYHFTPGDDTVSVSDSVPYWKADGRRIGREDLRRLLGSGSRGAPSERPIAD